MGCAVGTAGSAIGGDKWLNNAALSDGRSSIFADFIASRGLLCAIAGKNKSSIHSLTLHHRPLQLRADARQNAEWRDERTKFISTKGLNCKNTNSPPLNKKSAPFSLEIVAHDVFLQSKCACGEIGIRARLRIWCRETCRFESYQAHFFSACSPFDNRRKGIFSFLSSTPVLRREQRDAQHAQRDNLPHTIPTHRESVTRRDEAMRKTRGHFRKTSLVCVNTCGVSFNASAFSLPSHAHTRSSANFDNLPSPFTYRHIALIKNHLR